MREILFRGKAINRNKGYHRTKYKNGEWVYGLVAKLYDERFRDLLPAEMVNTNGISGIEIDYKTIGQYTGLTDKNGTKIFEGDIVKIIERGMTAVGVVKFRNIYRGGWIVGENNTDDDGCSLCRRNDVEVIGSIYDNPELLEGGALK